MNIISLPFIILLLLLLVVVYINNKTKRSRVLYVYSLITASVLFFIYNEPLGILIILVYAIVNYFGSKELTKTDNSPSYRKLIIILITLFNIGGLIYYKYSTFFVANLLQIGLFGTQFPVFLTAKNTLPLGISFFTFQAISYSIDVYLQRIKSGKFSDFFLYLIFFPKISSGPIMKAGDFFNQINKKTSINWEVFNESVYLIISGVFLKVVCADSVALIVEQLWSMGTNPESHAFDLIIIAIYFSIQIFCDFAGYTNIVRGIALLLGFRMPVNFIRPYTAISFSKFWQNWHISLTDWIRVYLFYPLERFSRNKIWLYFTPVLVMVIVGLWHGANWTFVMWGLLFGIGMSLERMTGINRNATPTYLKVCWAIVTQMSVIIGWIFFRSSSVIDGWLFIQNIIHGLTTPGFLLPTKEVLAIILPSIGYWFSSTDGSLYNLIFPAIIDLMPVFTIVFIHLSFLWEENQKKDKNRLYVGVGKAVLAGVMLFFCLSSYSVAQSPFLYFQF